MNDKTCEKCLYYRECDGGCMLEVFEGTDPEECRSANYKFFEAKDE